jgi:SAM-dependent methyltransferase
MVKSKALQYRFTPATACNMCGAGPEQFTTMGLRLNQSQGFRARALAGIAVGVRKCGVCQLIFADPQPLPENFSDHYGSAKDYWTASYFEADPRYLAQEIAEAKSLMPPTQKPRALDIGAGIGKAMQSLAAAGFEAFGIEPSQDFSKVAVTRGVPRDRLKLNSIDDASFEPESFDFITFGASLEHLPSPGDALGRALEWLKPGGIIQAEVPSSKYLIAKLVNLYFRLSGTNYVTNTSPMHPPYHLFEFGLRSFELNGRRLGYEVALHRYSVCDILHFPRFMHAPLRWFMARTNTGMQLTVFLRKPARKQAKSRKKAPAKA